MAKERTDKTPKDNVYKTTEERASFIEKRLHEYSKICKKPDQLNTINLDEVMGFMEYMSENLGESRLFDHSFIGLLKVIRIIARDPPVDFCNHFNELTKLLCNLRPTIGKHIALFNQILEHWIELLEFVPSNNRFTAYLLVDSELKKCAQSIFTANSASMQLKLLEIIHAYAISDASNPKESLVSLFNGIELRTNDLIDFVDIDCNSITQKQTLIHRLNERSQGPTIFTQTVSWMRIGNKAIPIKNDDGFIHFNKLAKTVEFLKEDMRVLIRARNIDKIQIIDNDVPYATEMVFHLLSPPTIETLAGKKYTNDTDTIIEFEFHSGFLITELQPLLQKTFKKAAEIISNNEPNEPVPDSDSDIEIVETERSFKRPKKEPHSGERTDCVIVPMDIDPTQVESLEIVDDVAKLPAAPIETVKPSDLFKASTSVPVKKEPRVSKRVRDGKRAKDESQKPDIVITLADNDMDQSPMKKKKPTNQIPTSSFYSKKKEPDSQTDSHAPRASKRHAALKAAGNIKNMADDAFSFTPEEPVHKKPRTPLKSKASRKTPFQPDVPIINPIKREGPKQTRKLFHEDDIKEVDASQEQPQRVKRWKDDELTAASFRSSFNVTTEKQHRRVFENVLKINESVECKRQNVSFSYLSTSAIVRKTKPMPAVAESTTLPNTTDALAHYNRSDDENMEIDVNANNRKCVCGLDQNTIEDIKEIARRANSVLSALDPNARKCQCGMIKGPESD